MKSGPIPVIATSKEDVLEASERLGCLMALAVIGAHNLGEKKEKLLEEIKDHQGWIRACCITAMQVLK